MRINTLKNSTIFFLASFLFSACSGNAEVSAHDRLILKDGLVDIPIIAGSKITNNCGSIGVNLENEIEYGCIEYSIESEGVNGKDWDTDYSKELIKNGWKWAGGESIAYYFEKPLDENCSNRLTMLGWMQATEEQEKIYNETGSLEGVRNLVFIFGVEDGLVCGSERNAKE